MTCEPSRRRPFPGWTGTAGLERGAGDELAHAIERLENAIGER